MSDTPRDDPRELVRRAFSIARDQGKPDWRRMTTAVLKNRMLLISNGSFDERNYGASSFREFLLRLHELVRIDVSSKPARVELLEDVPQEKVENEESSQNPILRPDLWRAALDYRSGETYVWDPATRAARVGHESAECKRIPTASPDDLRAWRASFRDAQLAQCTVAEKAKIDRWATEGLGTHELPRRMRGPWNQHLRDSVRGRLQEWFQREGLEQPADLIHGQKPRHDDATDLRSLVIDCIGIMTAEELGALLLPAKVLFRLRKRS